jgi:MFS transporter, FHS family, glucose/mannose:H+ symporter
LVQLRDSMRAAYRILFAGLVTFVLMGFGQALFGPTLPEVTRKFALAPGHAALLVTAQWVGSAMGVAAMFFLTQRIVPRHALALLTIGGAGLAWQPYWWAMLISSLVFGVGYGLAAASFNPRVMAGFGERGASMLSLLNAAFAAGAIVAPLAFVWIGSTSSIAYGIVAAVCAGVFLFASDSKTSGPSAAGPTAGGLRPNWLILAFGAVAVGIEACLIGLGPTALIATGETEEQAARYLSGFFIAFLAARMTLGFTAHLAAPFLLYVAAFLWAAACILAALFWAPGLAFVAIGISGGMFFPCYYITAARKMGDDPRVTPLILSAGLVGGIGMPIVIAFAMPGLGPYGFFWLLCGLIFPTLALAGLSLSRLAR